MTEVVAWAAAYGRNLLEPLEDRWRHTVAVAEQAARIGAALDPGERDLLVAAAYLHDIGYAPTVVATGFHALDGGRHIRALGQERLAGLVAYHSGARYEAELRGFGKALGEFQDEASALTRALTYCDMTTGPTGQRVTLDERLGEIERRYGSGHVVSQAMWTARPWLEECVVWVEATLRQPRAR